MEANPEQFLEGVCAPTLSLVFVIRPTKLLDAQICGVTGSNKNGWGWCCSNPNVAEPSLSRVQYLVLIVAQSIPQRPHLPANTSILMTIWRLSQTTSIADYLKDRSNECHDHSDDFLSVYVCVVQTSMYGSYYGTLYVCLRGERWTGYSRRPMAPLLSCLTLVNRFTGAPVIWGCWLVDRFESLKSNAFSAIRISINTSECNGSKWLSFLLLIQCGELF